jgi:hypothetical protein
MPFYGISENGANIQLDQYGYSSILRIDCRARDEWFFRFVIWDHFFHKLIYLNYWSEILRPPLSALGRLMRLICRKICCASPRAKGVYRNLIAADVTEPLGLTGYRGIVSAGTFTLGHVGPEGILPLLEIAEKGCLFVISVNAQHYQSVEFEVLFAKIDPQIVDLTFEDVRTYSDKADLSHRHDIARLVQFKKA